MEFNNDSRVQGLHCSHNILFNVQCTHEQLKLSEFIAVYTKLQPLRRKSNCQQIKPKEIKISAETLISLSNRAKHVCISTGLS